MTLSKFFAGVCAHDLFACTFRVVVGCWLLVVGCWLLVVGCWLLVVGVAGVVGVVGYNTVM